MSDRGDPRCGRPPTRPAGRARGGVRPRPPLGRQPIRLVDDLPRRPDRPHVLPRIPPGPARRRATRFPHNYTCYAESDDGLAWTRPDLGMHALEEAEANNIILSGQPALTFTPFLDTNPDCAADQRYKALALRYDPAAARAVRLRLGRRHPLVANRRPAADHYRPTSDSQNLAFWDATRGEYRAYVRRFPRQPRRGRPRGRPARRPDLHLPRLPRLGPSRSGWHTSRNGSRRSTPTRSTPTTAHRTYSSVCPCATSPATAT